MPTEIVGKLQVRRQRLKRADGQVREDIKVFVYIPAQLWRDSQFPFKIETQDVQLTVDLEKGTLLVKKRRRRRRRRLVEKASNMPGRGE